MDAYTILGVSPGATQQEIYQAYKRLALKYHPDKNRGNEEWAKQKFIEVGEAYKTLSKSAPKRKFEFSNKPGSDKFKEFEEMLNELREDFEEIGKGFKEDRENLNRVQEGLREEAIKNTEESLALTGVSASDLNPSLWVPYGSWQEKFRSLFDNDISIFLSQMTAAIEEAKRKKNNNNYRHNYGNSYSSWNSQTPPERDYDNSQPSFSDKNFFSNNGEWTGDENPNLTLSDKIRKLKKEIEYEKNYLLKTSNESEKQKCREMIDKWEKELRELQTQASSNSNNPNNDNKDEKISQLEAEIEQLKKDRPRSSQKQQENQRKITEKEQELSDLKKNNDDYEDLTHEQLVDIIKKLKVENEISELTEKIRQLEKIIQQLVEENQELRTEIQVLKNKNNRSEYEEHYLNRQESRLNNNESTLNKLNDVLESVNNSEISNPNENKFPTGLVIGGGILATVLLVALLVAKKYKKKKIRK